MLSGIKVAGEEVINSDPLIIFIHSFSVVLNAA